MAFHDTPHSLTSPLHQNERKPGAHFVPRRRQLLPRRFDEGWRRILAESLGGAASFISAVLDVTHPPLVSPYSKTTLFHAHFSSPIQRHDRVLNGCTPANRSPLLISHSRRFQFGLGVGVAGEILPETLEKMLDICDTVFVDVQALIRVFDPADGTVSLVHLRFGFHHLLRRIGFLKRRQKGDVY
ncbi:UNVERIFIED_CONTAM: Inositol 3-kinase [Sesamum radiatum]|uniref:Inositol 3-kinase n=1 Tax=Sesamum radiatum TaxID=300843 RepID=A0AAW2UPR7_SESRA